MGVGISGRETLLWSMEGGHIHVMFSDLDYHRSRLGGALYSDRGSMGCNGSHFIVRRGIDSTLLTMDGVPWPQATMPRYDGHVVVGLVFLHR